MTGVCALEGNRGRPCLEDDVDDFDPDRGSALASSRIVCIRHGLSTAPAGRWRSLFLISAARAGRSPSTEAGRTTQSACIDFIAPLFADFVGAPQAADAGPPRVSCRRSFGSRISHRPSDQRRNLAARPITVREPTGGVVERGVVGGCLFPKDSFLDQRCLGPPLSCAAVVEPVAAAGTRRPSVSGTGAAAEAGAAASRRRGIRARRTACSGGRAGRRR